MLAEKKKTPEDFVNASKKIDYDKLGQNGKVSGIVVTGASLSSASDVVNEYISYYKDAGFKFEKAKAENTVEFLKKKIESGEASYLVKEAHSEGDANSVVSVNEKSNVLRGVKKLANGKEEVIYLLAPDKPDYKTTKRLGLREFGEAMEKRNKNGEKPFVYFNTSCSSDFKVLNEVQEVANSSFINVGSTTTAYTFANRDNSGLKQMIDGFRQKKTYEEIRQMMQKDRGYANGRSNQFIFPDQDEYKNKITDKLTPPTITDIKISRDQKPYVFSDEIH